MDKHLLAPLDDAQRAAPALGRLHHQPCAVARDQPPAPGDVTHRPSETAVPLEGVDQRELLLAHRVGLPVTRAAQQPEARLQPRNRHLGSPLQRPRKARRSHGPRERLGRTALPDQLRLVLRDEVGVNRAFAVGRMLEHPQQEGAVVGRPHRRHLLQRPDHAAPGLFTVAAPGDNLGNHRVVVVRDL